MNEPLFVTCTKIYAKLYNPHVLPVPSEIKKQTNNPAVLPPSRPSDWDGLHPEEAADHQHPRHLREGKGEGGEGGVPAVQVRPQQQTHTNHHSKQSPPPQPPQSPPSSGVSQHAHRQRGPAVVHCEPGARGRSHASHQQRLYQPEGQLEGQVPPQNVGNTHRPVHSCKV